MRALVVEDEPDLADAICQILTELGIVCDRAGTCEDTVHLAATNPYALAVLDRRLPDGDGVTLLPRLRVSNENMPVLVLTARDQVAERIEGLESGADDYLAKPFDPGELRARLRALIRRPGLETDVPLVVGALAFAPRLREVSVAGRPLALPMRELNIVEALVRRAHRVVTREALFEAVYSMDCDVASNALDVNVSRVRTRLRELEAGVEIVAVRGVGYMLTAA